MNMTVDPPSDPISEPTVQNGGVDPRLLGIFEDSKPSSNGPATAPGPKERLNLDLPKNVEPPSTLSGNVPSKPPTNLFSRAFASPGQFLLGVTGTNTDTTNPQVPKDMPPAPGPFLAREQQRDYVSATSGRANAGDPDMPPARLTSAVDGYRESQGPRTQPTNAGRVGTAILATAGVAMGVNVPGATGRLSGEFGITAGRTRPPEDKPTSGWRAGFKPGSAGRAPTFTLGYDASFR